MFIRRYRLYLWSIGAGTCRQGYDTDNGCEKNMKPKVMKIWDWDTPETIYY
uniref:hypothetical protein n=1 Tax=Candidatus Enterovibrio escicola TaxID=1927127 RepID=UPI001CC220A8|nr:hypothetical protein [Candidatus Enterovibrio escacola]